jgi:hypothetical protein
MRYRDITADDRFRLPTGYPVLASITIDVVDHHRFERLVDDTAAARIVGQDNPCDGQVTMHVACASQEVRCRLMDGWC